METLFRWIHLSDIHVGHGDKSHGWDQELVMDVLRRDIAAQVTREHAPIDAILVTGDIAFSGAGKSADEYGKATKWLGDVAVAAGVNEQRIFVVPGNHDVNRGADKDRNTKRLLDELRGPHGNIDLALADGGDRALLAGRMKNYLAFAAAFAPAKKRPGTPAQLVWVDRLFPTGTDFKVRLVGMNTALLAADDQDKGKLQLGREQLHSALMDPAVEEGELVIVLSHHPFADGWLADQKEIAGWVRNHTHLHLSGHVHEAETEAARKGSGGVFVRVTAGAAHGDQLPPGVPAGHGYSYGAILRSDQGKAMVRIWPRKWSAPGTRFQVDQDGVDDDLHYAEHELRLSLPARAASRRDPVNTPTVPIAARTPTLPIITPAAGTPVKVFMSSCDSDEDKKLSDKLYTHLVPLQRKHLIEITRSEAIVVGKDVRTRIEEELRSAKIILLLLSADYLGWEHCDDDLSIARARHEAGAATVIPIVLRPVELDDPRSNEVGKEWFAGLVRLPRDGKPVAMRSNTDAALAEIAGELRKLVAPGKAAR